MSGRLAFRIVISLATLAAPPAARGDGIMLINAGAFRMGRDDGAPEEAPLHRVFVTDFWILRPYPYKLNESWSGVGAVVVRGASHDDSAQELSVTRRRFYERRGAATGHHFVGFRCASDRHGGPDMAPKPPNARSAPGSPERSSKGTGR